MKTVKELLITIICFTLVFPTSLLAAPSGGQVVRGNVTIKQTSTTTTIDQSSNRAIVNWKNFDIAKNEAVLHNMPGASSAALHRVVGGGGASQLAGLLRSNGNIFLVNPAGVVIHNGARIETGGFTATTRDISNDNFMKGNMVFDKPGRPDAKIINRGNITVRDSGLAALVAPTVRNEGIIAARLGKIALASGDSAFKLDMYGDDLIAFTVAENDVNQLYATDGTPLGVSNTGTIKAEGGVVLLSASQLDGIVSSVVNNGGTVTASSAEVKGGKIVFKGEGSNVDVVNTGTVTASSEKGDGGAVRMTADGKVTVSGTVEAKGAQKGGQVDVSGKKETVTAGVTINVEGSTGGLVRLGGEFQGGKATLTANADMRRNFVERFGTQAPLAETQKLTVDSASAISVGRDGTLVAWSGGLTDIRGALQGKYVETSGKSLNLQAMPIIHEGYLLIDPTNITISPSVTNTTDYFDGTTFDYSYEGSATVNAGDLAALLKTNNNVYLTASNSITIGPFGNAGESSSYRGTLDLSAQVIYVTGALNFGPGGVIFRAESSMSMASGSSIQGTGEIDIRGSALTLNAGARINSSRVDIWGKLDRNTAGTGYDAILQGIDVTLENNAGITATDRVEIYANTLTLNNAVIRSYNNLSIAGGRTGRPGPDNSSENDNSYQKNKDTLILGLNSLINASGHINLYIKGIQSAGSGQSLRFISDNDEITLHTFESSAVSIPVGTRAQPTFEAQKVYFGAGNYSLGTFSVKAKEIEITQSTTLTGVSSAGDPHIIGFEHAYLDTNEDSDDPGQLITTWPFPSVILESSTEPASSGLTISAAATSGLSSFSFNASGQIVYTGTTDAMNLNINDLLAAITAGSSGSFLITSSGSLTLESNMTIAKAAGLGFQAVGDILIKGAIGLQQRGNLLVVSTAGSITVNGGIVLKEGVMQFNARDVSIASTVQSLSNGSLTVKAAGGMSVGANAKIDVGTAPAQVLDIEADTFVAHANSVMRGGKINFHVREAQFSGSNITGTNALTVLGKSGGKARQVVVGSENGIKSQFTGRDIILEASQLTIDDAAFVGNVSISLDTDNGTIGSGAGFLSESGKISFGVSQSLEIARGSLTAPIFNADTVKLWGAGTATLYPYAIKTANFEYADGIKLVGRQGERTVEPHIFGLANSWFTGTGEGMRYAGMSQDQWPHATLLLASASGALWPKGAIDAGILAQAQAAYDRANAAKVAADQAKADAAVAQSKADGAYNDLQRLLPLVSGGSGSASDVRDYQLAKKAAEDAQREAEGLAAKAGWAEAEAVAARTAANNALAAAANADSVEAHSKAMQAVDLANQAEGKAREARAAAEAARRRASDALALVPDSTPVQPTPPPYVPEPEPILPTPPDDGNDQNRNNDENEEKKDDEVNQSEPAPAPTPAPEPDPTQKLLNAMINAWGIQNKSIFENVLTGVFGDTLNLGLFAFLGNFGFTLTQQEAQALSQACIKAIADEIAKGRFKSWLGGTVLLAITNFAFDFLEDTIREYYPALKNPTTPDAIIKEAAFSQGFAFLKSAANGVVAATLTGGLTGAAVGWTAAKVTLLFEETTIMVKQLSRLYSTLESNLPDVQALKNSSFRSLLDDALYFSQYRIVCQLLGEDSDLAHELYRASHSKLDSVIIQEVLFDLEYPGEMHESIGVKIGKIGSDFFRDLFGTTLNEDVIDDIGYLVTSFVEALGYIMAGDRDKAISTITHAEEVAKANDDVLQEDTFVSRNATPSQNTFKKLLELFGMSDLLTP